MAGEPEGRGGYGQQLLHGAASHGLCQAVCSEADRQAGQTEREMQGAHAGGPLLQLACHAWHVQAGWASLAVSWQPHAVLSTQSCLFDLSCGRETVRLLLRPILGWYPIASQPRISRSSSLTVSLFHS